MPKVFFYILAAVRIRGPFLGLFPEPAGGDRAHDSGLDCVRGHPGDLPSTVDHRCMRTGLRAIGLSDAQNH